MLRGSIVAGCTANAPGECNRAVRKAWAEGRVRESEDEPAECAGIEDVEGADSFPENTDGAEPEDKQKDVEDEKQEPESNPSEDLGKPSKEDRSLETPLGNSCPRRSSLRSPPREQAILPIRRRRRMQSPRQTWSRSK